MLDGDLRVVSANRSFYRAFQTSAKQTEGEMNYELGVGQWDIPRLRELLEEILPKNAEFEDYQVEVEIPKLGRRVILLNARRLQQTAGGPERILLVLEVSTSTYCRDDIGC